MKYGLINKNKNIFNRFSLNINSLFKVKYNFFSSSNSGEKKSSFSKFKIKTDVSNAINKENVNNIDNNNDNIINNNSQTTTVDTPNTTTNIFDEDNENIQEKYKDFTIANIKQQEEKTRKEYYYTTKKLNEIYKKNPEIHANINSVLLSKNFLNPKNKPKQKQKENKLNLEEIEKLDISNEPILLYEINMEYLKIINRITVIFKLYLSTCIGLNLCAFILQDFFLTYSDWMYFIFYFSHTFTFAAGLCTYHLRKYKILQIEYLHKDKKVKIVKWKLTSRQTEEFYYDLNDIEVETSNKILSFPILIKIKNTNITYGLDNMGIWHNFELFQTLTGNKINI
jgi:hypothetical protein